jgi:hypothetical protein
MRTGIAIMTLAVLVVPAGASGLPGPEDRNCERAYGGKTFSPLIKRSWAERKWEDKTPVSNRQAKRIENHRRCARDGKAQRAMVSMTMRQRKQFREYRREQLRATRSDCIAGVTVYEGGGGCWAIPAEIVACESGYSWSAYNSSGARGPYQFLGWPVPWPVDSVADKRAHHRMAASLYAGGAGRSHWVC